MKFSNTVLSSTILGTLALADGQFNVLSFNVAGLPQILQDNGESLDKSEATQHIGEIFSSRKDEFDIIHVQEDFNYHATLYKYDTHPYRTATSGGAGFGSGLNTLSNYDWINFSRIKWETCSDASESDCLTPKGFTHFKLAIEDGVYINFINLHADAGVEDGDETARNSNLKQIADYIDSNAYDEAVIVYGDTNSRYTRSLDNITIFQDQNGLTDAWVELVLDGVPPVKGSDALLCSLPADTLTCEIVDKVFYRGSKVVELKADAFDYVGDVFVYEGNQLSDHNPALVNFTYTINDEFKTSNLIGGDHSDFFNDILKVSTGVKPTKLSFRGNERLDSVGLTLSDSTVFQHGGDGGVLSELSLDDDEYWTQAYLCTGTKNDELRNFYINATTSHGNTLEAGTETEDCYYLSAPNGYQIVGFYGEAGDEVDQLGFIYSKQQ